MLIRRQIKSLHEVLPHLAKAGRSVEGFAFYGNTSNYNPDQAAELLDEFKKENPSVKDDSYVAYIVGSGNETQAYIEGGMELWHEANLANIHLALWVHRPGAIVIIKERHGHYSVKTPLLPSSPCSMQTSADSARVGILNWVF